MQTLIRVMSLSCLMVLSLTLGISGVSQALAPCGVTITPYSATLSPGGTQCFTASNEEWCVNEPQYTWSVVGSCGGTIDSNGCYTAPGTLWVTCTDTIRVIDTANDVEATATVTIIPPPCTLEIDQDRILRSFFIPLPALLTVSAVGEGCGECVGLLSRVGITSEPLSLLQLVSLGIRRNNTIQLIILVLPSIINRITEDEVITVCIPGCGCDTVIIDVPSLNDYYEVAEEYSRKNP